MRTREIREHYCSRRNRLKDLATTVEDLISKAKKWHIANLSAADELTIAIIEVERALERLE